MKFIQRLKYMLLRTFKTIFRGCYWLLSLLASEDENKVVVVVSRSDELEGNLKFIRDEIIVQKPKAEIHLIFPENKMNLKLFKELFIISDAKYLILDDYYLPIYLIKPKETMKVIQLWHAAGAFKKFGFSTIDKTFGPDLEYLKLVPIHSNYTNVYVSSENMVDHYAEAFNMPKKNIFPLGIPRADLFSDEKEKENIMKKITSTYEKMDSSKVAILFAPTYRATNKQRESDVDFLEILINMSRDLNKDKIIVYKPHPYLVDESIGILKDCTNILVADKYSINDWMLVSDAFFTDYSSAVFEYALLKKPLAHFVPDLLEYEKNRGLYYPIEKISDGVIIKEYNEMIKWINNRKKNETWDTKKMLEFNFSNVNNASEKITQHFLN